MARLESDIEGQTNASFRQWLGCYLDAKNGLATSEPDGGGTRLCRRTIGRRPGIPPRSYGVYLRNRRCDCKRFQTLHYPCAHVVAVCAKVGLNVEKFIDEVYTIKRTLRVWENEFPVLSDKSTWEVPPTTIELIPDKKLRRNPKGHPQSSRIHNEMNIREKSDDKLCGVCRLAGHNRSKCPLRNYHVGQSSQSGRN
ncbi:hypothetical protein GOBAR_DD33163 [Gossypium barbadense]|nr:hypothetical protein GOBAR_DD33163 [Gossypium barbadense]